MNAYRPQLERQWQPVLAGEFDDVMRIKEIVRDTFGIPTWLQVFSFNDEVLSDHFNFFWHSLLGNGATVTVAEQHENIGPPIPFGMIANLPPPEAQA